MINFDKDNCQGCALCVGVCPKKLIQLDKENLNGKGFAPADVKDKGKCISCAFCATMCPHLIITIDD